MLTSIITNDNYFYDNNQYQRRSQIEFNKKKLFPKINNNKGKNSNSIISKNKSFTIFKIKTLNNKIKNNSIKKNREIEKKLFKNILKNKKVNSNNKNRTLNNSLFTKLNDSTTQNSILGKSAFPLINKGITISNGKEKMNIDLNKDKNNYKNNNTFYKNLYLEYKGENNDKGFNNITYIEINPHKIISSLKKISDETHYFKKNLFTTFNMKLNYDSRNNHSNKSEILTSSHNENNNFIYYYNNIFNKTNYNNYEDTNNNNTTLVYDKFLLPNKNNEYTFSIHNLFLFDIINKVFKKTTELHDNHNKIITEEEILKEYNKQVKKLKLFFDKKIEENKKGQFNKMSNNENNYIGKSYKNVQIKDNNQSDKSIKYDIMTDRKIFYNIKSKLSFKNSLKSIFYQHNDNNIINNSITKLIPSHQDKKYLNKNKSKSNSLINKYDDSIKSIYQLELGPKINIIDINEILYQMDKQSKYLINNAKTKVNENNLIKFILLDKNNINKLKFDNPILNKYIKVLVNNNQKEKIQNKKNIYFKDIKTLEIIGNKLDKKIYIQKGIRKKNKKISKLHKTNYSSNFLSRYKINDNLKTSSNNNSYLTQSDMLCVKSSESDSEEKEEIDYIDNLNLEEIRNSNINEILKDELFKEKEKKNKIIKEENIYKEKNIEINENKSEYNQNISKSTSLNNIYGKINKIRKYKLNKFIKKNGDKKENEKFSVNILELNPMIPQQKEFIKMKEGDIKNIDKSDNNNNSLNKKNENIYNRIKINISNKMVIKNIKNKIKENKVKNKEKEEKDINNPKNFNLFIKSINNEYNIPNSDKNENNENDSMFKRISKRKLTVRKNNYNFMDVFQKLNKIKFNESYFIEDEDNMKNNEVSKIEMKDIKNFYKTISYFPIKPITRIALLKPNLRNAFTNLKIVEKSQFKNMIISVMKEKPITKKESKRIVENKIKIFLYNEEKKNEEKEGKDEKEEDKEAKEEGKGKKKENDKQYKEEKETVIHNILRSNEKNNINEILKKIKVTKFNKRTYNPNFQLFYNYERNKENDKEIEIIKTKKKVKKIKKKDRQNLIHFFYEDNDCYSDKKSKLIKINVYKDIKRLGVNEEDNIFMKEFEKFKIRNRKLKIERELNFEEKFEKVKNELKRLKKLSDEDFLKDTLLYLNEDIDNEDLKREKLKNKINRINEYKEFLKISRKKDIEFKDKLCKTQIIFKPSCEFITSKIEK